MYNIESCQMHVLMCVCVCVGSGKKRVKFEDEILEFTERRRSSRIIALEEKKQKEKERKLALALAKRNNLANQIDNTNKEKGKAKIDAGDYLDDEKHGLTKKGFNSRAFEQLISSIKVLCLLFLSFS